jgi:hypothetical protein
MNVPERFTFGLCPYCDKKLCAKEPRSWVQLPCPRCRKTVVVCDGAHDVSTITPIAR